MKNLPKVVASGPIRLFAPVVEALGLGVIGAVLGMCAWRAHGTPGLAVFVPVLWALSTTRVGAIIAGCSYCLAVVRFLPAMASNWYSAPMIGYVFWLAVGGAGGLLFGFTWTAIRRPLRCGLRVAILLLLWLPLGIAIPGHPLFGWGYVVPQSEWTGVVLAFVATTFVATWIRMTEVRTTPALLALLCAVTVGIFGTRYRPESRVELTAESYSGQVIAVSTSWGSYPAHSSQEVERRLRRIAALIDRFAIGVGNKILIFPEAVLGEYTSLVDASLRTMVEKVNLTGKVTLVVGVDVELRSYRYGNAVSIHHTGERESWVLARQSTPIAQWRPWALDAHFPSNWLRSTAIELGSGQRAAVIFCHEEYSAGLYLLSLWRDQPTAIIAVSNLWAASNGLANVVQGAHTEGISRLFGLTMFRSVNLPVTSGASEWITLPRR